MAKVTRQAIEIDYISVGHDIIYGLPFQTIEDVLNTIDKTKLIEDGLVKIDNNTIHVTSNGNLLLEILV